MDNKQKETDSTAAANLEDLGYTAAYILAYCICAADKKGCIDFTFQRLCTELENCNIRLAPQTVKLNLLILEKRGLIKKVLIPGAPKASRRRMGTHYKYQLIHLQQVLKALDLRPQLPLEDSTLRIKAEELYRREKLAGAAA